ncbi:MAG: M23 family metallopeptidase [Hyphomicrobiaceae bacterium]
MLDRRRHAPVGRWRNLSHQRQHKSVAEAYLGRARRRSGDIYTSDHAETRRGGRFRWLVSTCLAAGVGALAILVVIAGAADSDHGDVGLMPTLQRIRETQLRSLSMPSARSDGLRWSTPKTDRLLVASGALATRFIIHEMQRQRRGNREYIINKPYARIVARLGPVSKEEAATLPPFNPFKLYANTSPLEDGEGKTDSDSPSKVSVKVVELLGGLLPNEDDQEMDTREVAELVGRLRTTERAETAMRPGFDPDGTDKSRSTDLMADKAGVSASDPIPTNTSVLAKNVFENDDNIDDIEGREVRVVRIVKGDTLQRILAKLGAETWQARAMADAARTAYPEAVPGQEVYVTLVPSVTEPGRSEPVRFSVYGEGHQHKVTVARTAAGEYTARASPLDEQVARAVLDNNDQPQAASLYASLYHVAETQGMSADTIMQIMRVHAYETDFRRRVRPGDSVEFFFGLDDEEKGAEPKLDELLMTSITSGGEMQRFYRYRTPDGVIDYYDEKGNNSKKFLMRRPVRGDVRLASGFGVRFHPLLNERRMHTGVDWATATGTPILAAGAGVIEEVGRKGQYGNYVRIRHANGYQTAYGHMQRFADGAAPGVKVRQGQVIGYVGSTGLASGPHVHFEILVNNRFVDPLSIDVPRERQLTGRQLADFQKERARIDELIRRNPVSAQVAEATTVRR